MSNYRDTSNYKAIATRDPETGAVIAVDVRDGWQIIGGWKRPHRDVWAASLGDKDEVRRLVDATGAKRLS